VPETAALVTLIKAPLKKRIFLVLILSMRANREMFGADHLPSIPAHS